MNIFDLAFKHARYVYRKCPQKLYYKCKKCGGRKIKMSIILDYAIYIRKWMDNVRNEKYIDNILAGKISPQLKYKHSLKKERKNLPIPLTPFIISVILILEKKKERGYNEDSCY